MRKRMLFDIPKMVFGNLVRKYTIKNRDIRDFTLDWMGLTVPATYAILPETSSLERPTLVFVDFREFTNINSTRILVLRNPPTFEIDNVVPEKNLDQYFKMEVGEYESSQIEIKHVAGCKVDLYLESFFSNGVINMTDEKNIFSGIYSLEIMSMSYQLLLSQSYDWKKEYFKTTEGIIIPL